MDCPIRLIQILNTSLFLSTAPTLQSILLTPLSTMQVLVSGRQLNKNGNSHSQIPDCNNNKRYYIFRD